MKKRALSYGVFCLWLQLSPSAMAGIIIPTPWSTISCTCVCDDGGKKYTGESWAFYRLTGYNDYSGEKAACYPGAGSAMVAKLPVGYKGVCRKDASWFTESNTTPAVGFSPNPRCYLN